VVVGDDRSLTLRGYLTVYVNLCWAFGQLIAAGVLEGFATHQSEWAYRIPFALQWVFPLPLFILIWFAPESPWWLVRKGRLEEAAQSLRRLKSNSAASAKEAIALIQHTNMIEEETRSGTSYGDCFRGVNLRRTEIICMVFAAQIWSGSPLGGTPSYFFVQAGVPTSTAFKFSVGGLGLASLGTIVSWALLNRFGRRTLYVWGMAVLTGCLLVTGIVACVSTGSTSSYVQAGFIMGWLLVYYLSVGPVCYAIISETSAIRLRNKSVCLSRISYYISQVIGSVIEPYMVNPGNANWKGKAALFWAGTSAVFFVWTFLRLPETKDRSYEELDLLFIENIAARRFSKMKVDAYASPGNRIKEE
jgi:SP family general alpha glucoside:H+ symporter-like MFS transporter